MGDHSGREVSQCADAKYWFLFLHISSDGYARSRQVKVKAIFLLKPTRWSGCVAIATMSRQILPNVLNE